MISGTGMEGKAWNTDGRKWTWVAWKKDRQSSETQKSRWTSTSRPNYELDHLRPLEATIAQVLVYLDKNEYKKVYRALNAPDVIASGEKDKKTEERIAKIKDSRTNLIAVFKKEMESSGPLEFHMSSPPKNAEEIWFFYETGGIYYRIGLHWYRYLRD